MKMIVNLAAAAVLLAAQTAPANARLPPEGSDVVFAPWSVVCLQWLRQYLSLLPDRYDKAFLGNSPVLL